jgi:hypothetical protein
MVRKNIFSKIIALLFVFSTLFLSGCFDLGDTKDIEDYYNAFPNVSLLYATETQSEDQTTHQITITKSLNTDILTMDKFYSDKTVDDFLCNVDFQKYMYLAVEVQRNCNIEEFSLYLKGQSNLSLDYEIFLTNNVPTKVRLKQKIAGETSQDFNEPSSNDAIYSSSIILNDSNFNSFTAKNWTINGTKNLSSFEVSSGQFLLLRFRNNCLYENMTPSQNGELSFQMTNILIRSKV